MKFTSNQSSASDVNVSKAFVRLDKWLWAARFFKTRALAREVIQGGKIQYNGARTKPSKLVEVGATIRIPQGYSEKIVVIKEVLDKRQGAPKAQLMYEETAESIKKRRELTETHKLMAHNPRPDNRPDKKQRRELIKFKHKE